MTRNFKRDYILSTIDIVGLYKFDVVFQIIALDDSHRKPNPGHVPLLLEYSFEVDEEQRKHLLGDMCLEAPENFKEKLIHGSYYKSKRDEIMDLLTLFTPSMFFIYNRNMQECSWFVPLHSDCRELFWGQKFYFPKENHIEDQNDFSEPSIKEIPRMDSSEYYRRLFTYPGQNTADEEFTLPDNIDTLFEKYYTLEKKTQSAFLQASTLFNQSMKIWFESKSLAYTALISCIEILIEDEYRDVKYEPCNSCNTKNYAVMKKFRDFFGVDDLPTADKSRKYINMLYNLRSNILHKGYLFQEDLSVPGYNSSKEADQRSLLMNIVSITRKRMLKWLLDHE